MPTTVALVDAAWSGHHRGYFRAFLSALLARGHRVVAACPRPDQLGAHTHSPQVHPIHFESPRAPRRVLGRMPETLTALRHWTALAGALRHARWPIDHVFLAVADPFLARYVPASLPAHLLGTSWSGLVLNARDLRFPSHQAHRRPRLALLAGATAVATLDEGLHGRLREVAQRPVVLFPDFLASDTVPDQTAKRAVHRASRGRPVAVLAGALTPRKGLLHFLRAARTMPDWHFVVAGQVFLNMFSAAERALIVRTLTRGRRVQYIRQLSDATFHGVLSAADVIWAAYDAFPSSSNMLTWASRVRARVVVRPGALLAERVEAHQLGAVLHGDAPTDIRRAFERALRAAPTWDHYAATHARAHVEPALHAMMSAAGLPPQRGGWT